MMSSPVDAFGGVRGIHLELNFILGVAAICTIAAVTKGLEPSNEFASVN